MYRVVYFKRTNGEEPAREWIKAQNTKVRASIFGKKDDLSREGLNILGTNALKVILGKDGGFYELRNVSLNWRIGVYFDQRENTFILLHGWRHDASHPKEHQKEIEKARRLLHEYLEQRGNKNA